MGGVFPTALSRQRAFKTLVRVVSFVSCGPQAPVEAHPSELGTDGDVEPPKPKPQWFPKLTVLPPVQE